MWRLVGREAELKTAVEFIQSGAGVAIAGEAGVGKSRLLGELAEVAVDSSGSHVYRITATEATGTIPFGVFADLLPKDTTADRLQLLKTVRSGLLERAADDSILLAIDDAHELDEGSLAVVWSMATEGEAKLVTTVRTGEQLPRSLIDLWKDGHVRRMELGPLSVRQTARLIEEALGSVDDSLRDELWRLTRGNPLFLQELIEGARDRGAIARNESGAWTIDGPLITGGDRLTDIVESRLAHLEEAGREAYDFVALGAPLPLSIITAISDPQLIESLEARGLILRDPDTSEMKPIHPLYGEVAIAAMPPSRKERLLGRLVRTAVDAGFPGSVDLLRASVWQQESGKIHDASIALEGAEIALARHDGDLAQKLALPVFEQSVQASAAIPLGRALNLQNRYDEAEEVFAKALAEEDEATGRLASARANNLAFGLGALERAGSVLERATASIKDAAWSAKLDEERAMLAAFAGDFSATLEASQAVIDNPEAPPYARASAFINLGLAQAMTGDLTAVFEHFDERLETILSQRENLPLGVDQYLLVKVAALMAAGRINDALDLSLVQASQFEEGRGIPAWLTQLAVVLDLKGDLDSAKQRIDQSLPAHEGIDPFGLHAQALGIASMIIGERGESPKSAELARMAAESAQPEPRIQIWVGRGRAWAHASEGNTRSAAETAAAAGIDAVSADHVTWGIWALHDSVRFGHPEIALDKLRAALAQTRGAILQEIMLEHAEVLARGDGEGLVQVGIEFAGRGARLFAVEAAAQASSCLADIGDSEGAARAATFSKLWERDCTGIGTPAVRERVNGPTDRELEIARLAALGLSSPEISKRTYISSRTVDNHLRSVYKKLGLSSRQELSEFLPID